MPLSLPEFLCQMTASPALTLTVLLTLAVLLVNGWTMPPMPSPPLWSPGPSLSVRRLGWPPCATFWACCASRR